MNDQPPNGKKPEGDHPLQDIVTEIERTRKEVSEEVPTTEVKMAKRPTAEVSQATFTEGTVIGGRYLVRSFVARGGMGEVYEVEDLELQEYVALKTILPKYAWDQEAMARFRREIHLARKVTHPNVCRIFDIGHHHSKIALGERITFLTMELLRGESLESRIKAKGPLEPAEALPIIEQMCAGLAAAHDVGVIHRDFKSANVMLVPQIKGLRVVITDFGLARSKMPTQEEEVTKTTDGLVMGTPAFMAPEQVEGEPVTQRVDIYALGIVIFHMLTGKLPFSGENPLTTAVKRLKEPPPSPRLFVPLLNPTWERTILKCLARNPAMRFGDARSVAEELKPKPMSHEKTVISPLPAPPKHKKPGRFLLVFILLALLVGAFFVGKRYLSHHPSYTKITTQALSHQRKSLGILGFENLSENTQADWLSTALTEMLRSELIRTRTLRIISGETIARMRNEFTITHTYALSTETLRRIKGNIGADILISGSYLIQEEDQTSSIRLDLLVQDTSSGEDVGSISKVFEDKDLFTQIPEIGREIASLLKVKPFEVPAEGISQPADLTATRLYANGLACLRRWDVIKGKESLEKAVKKEPNNPLYHSALADAYRSLGFSERTREEAGLAFQLSSNLSREERLWIEGRYREAAREWKKAAKIYWKLLNFYPDNLEYGLRMAKVMIKAGECREALKVLETLKVLPEPDGKDPRIDLVMAEAAAELSDFALQMRAAKQAAKRAKERGAMLILAQADLSLGSVMLLRGKHEKAMESLQEAKGIFAKHNHWSGVASALLNLAQLYKARGMLEKAMNAIDESLIIFRENGTLSGAAKALNNMAGIHATKGEMEKALTCYEEALKLFNQTQDASGQASVWNNMGNLYRSQGEMEKAEEYYRQALDVYEKSGNHVGVITTMGNLAFIRYTRGDMVGSRNYLDKALTLSDKIGDMKAKAWTYANMGNLATYQKKLDEAKRFYKKSLKISRKQRDEDGTARALGGLGMIAYLKGDLDKANKAYRESLAIYTKVQNRSSMIPPLVSLGEIAIERRDSSRAVSRFMEAVTIAAQIGSRDEDIAITTKLAALYRERGEIENALMITEALMDRHQEGKEPQRAVIKAAYASLLSEVGRFDEGKEHLNEAYNLTKALDDHQVRLKVERAKAQVAWNEGELQLAKALFKELAAKSNGKVSLRDNLLIVHGYAWTLIFTGEEAKAAPLLAAIHEKATMVGDPIVSLEQRLLEAMVSDPVNEEMMQEVIQESKSAGFTYVNLEAHLVMGMKMLARGMPSGYARVESVKEEAEALGLTALALRASKLLEEYA